jgi:hypothetical protein
LFYKEQFANLLKQAKGNRSINKYGQDSGVDPGYISRLSRQLIESPPSVAIIKKLAEKAHNEITYESLMQAAGYFGENFHWVTDKDSGQMFFEELDKITTKKGKIRKVVKGLLTPYQPRSEIDLYKLLNGLTSDDAGYRGRILTYDQKQLLLAMLDQIFKE